MSVVDILKQKLKWKFIEDNVLRADLTKDQVKMFNTLPEDFTLFSDHIEYKGIRSDLYKFLCSKWVRGDDIFRKNINMYNCPIFIQLNFDTTYMYIFKSEQPIIITIPREAYKFDFQEDMIICRIM